MVIEMAESVARVGVAGSVDPAAYVRTVRAAADADVRSLVDEAIYYATRSSAGDRALVHAVLAVAAAVGDGEAEAAGRELFYALYHHSGMREVLGSASPGFVRAYARAQRAYQPDRCAGPVDD